MGKVDGSCPTCGAVKSTEAGTKVCKNRWHTFTKEELIKAIREHKLIGRGSYTTIDECYDDSELWDRFGPPRGNHTLDAAIKAAVESEDLHMEQGLNARCGEDDDPQLLEYNEWQSSKKEMLGE